MKTEKGDLLSVTEGIIVHGCNCQGQMGSGVAKAILDKWPGVYESYKWLHDKVGLKLGDTQAIYNPTLMSAKALRNAHISLYEIPEKLVVVNAMTQYNYGRDPNVIYVDYDAVEACFTRVRILARDTGLSVHFPMIGAGLGNGDWSEITTRIRKGLGDEHFEETTLWVLP